MQRHRRHRTRTSRSHVIEHPAEATGREGCHLNLLSSQSSSRFSFFRYDSLYIKVWHSIYPTGNAVLSQSAGRCFAPLQAEIAPKSPFLCVNRSLIWCVGVIRVPAKELSGKVWTYESINIIISYKFNQGNQELQKVLKKHDYTVKSEKNKLYSTVRATVLHLVYPKILHSFCPRFLLERL